MLISRRLVSLSIATAATLCAACSFSVQPATTPLFNGRNLDGWQHVGPGSFIVEGGTLKTQGGMGLLWFTREKIARAKLRVVFRLTGNNLIQEFLIAFRKCPQSRGCP